MKKTGEVTGTAKIRMDIRALNTRLAKCFETIGRAYYRQEKGLGEGHAETIASAIAEADSIKAEIAALREEMAKLQGCVICSACGAQISDKSIFCPLCGVKLPEPPKEETPAEETAAQDAAEETECCCESECTCETGEAEGAAQEAAAEDEPKTE